MFLAATNDANPQLCIASADEQYHSRVEIHCDTDIMVDATDRNQIDELIDTATGMLGTIANPASRTHFQFLRARRANPWRQHEQAQPVRGEDRAR